MANQDGEIEFEVTQGDIDKSRGYERDNTRCVVARALARKYHVRITNGDVSVGSWAATVQGRRYALALDAERLVMDFDSGRPVQPGTYHMRFETNNY